MREIKKIEVTIHGESEQLAVIAQFLRTLEYMGNIGATRTLSLWFDGDGAASIHLDFGKTDVSQVEPRDIHNDENLKFYIE